MNPKPPRPHDDPGADAPITESAWNAQEAAMAGARDASLDAERYRALARAISTWPEVPAPIDLAGAAVRAVEQAQARERARREALNGRLERTLLASLSSVFAAAALAAVIIYGAEWLALLAAHVPLLDGWMGVLLACIVAIHAPDAWRRLRSLEPGVALAD